MRTHFSSFCGHMWPRVSSERSDLKGILSASSHLNKECPFVSGRLRVSVKTKCNRLIFQN